MNVDALTTSANISDTEPQKTDVEDSNIDHYMIIIHTKKKWK